MVLCCVGTWYFDMLVPRFWYLGWCFGFGDHVRIIGASWTKGLSACMCCDLDGFGIMRKSGDLRINLHKPHLAQRAGPWIIWSIPGEFAVCSCIYIYRDIDTGMGLHIGPSRCSWKAEQATRTRCQRPHVTCLKMSIAPSGLSVGRQGTRTNESEKNKNAPVVPAPNLASQLLGEKPLIECDELNITSPAQCANDYTTNLLKHYLLP